MQGAPVLLMQYEKLIYWYLCDSADLARSIRASEIVKTPHIVFHNDQIRVLNFLFYPLLYL